MLDANLTGIGRGYDEVTEQYFSPKEEYGKVCYQEIQNEWGYENAPIGGDSNFRILMTIPDKCFYR